MLKKKWFALVVLISFFVMFRSANAGLINPGFEVPSFSPGVPSFDLPNEAAVPGWDTTASDDLMEFWSDGPGGLTSFEGSQHVELNAFEVSTIFQDAPGIAASSIVSFQFAHRGRLGVDTMRLRITDLGGDNAPGGGNDTVLFQKDYSTDSLAWAFYTSAGEPTITALGNLIRFEYESVSAAGGIPTFGNFIDAADFSVGVGGPPPPIPEPSTIVLFGVGILGILGYSYRRRKAAK